MEDMPEILLEDEAVLAVNKPAGMLTIRDGYDPALPYLSGRLQERYGRVWTVHRLDKDTSGVILFARSAEAHRLLNRQFEDKQVRKVYHALAWGVPEWTETRAEYPLRVDGDRRHRTVIDPRNGKPASTTLRVLETYPSVGASLIEARPTSGYTHQIRAHLTHLGFPLLGDALYARPDAVAGFPPLLTRTALHAAQISFIHPLAQEVLTVNAPYPDDFQQALEQLRGSVNSL